MPTIQIEANLSARELMRAVEQLSQPELESFVAEVLELRSRRVAPCLSPAEAELLRTINQGLSGEFRQRFDELKARRQAESLTPEEHAELLRLTDQLERQEAERLQALVDLAQLRKTSLRKLMDELGIQAPVHE